MAFQMAGELGIPMPLVQTYLNEGLGTIYDELIWSFQLGESGWLTPGMLFPQGSPLQSSGTITTTAYGNTIVGDATAAAAWVAYNNAGTLPLVTQCQIRVPLFSLYNIIAFDGVNTFTIDRPWTEPPGAGQTYMVYQAYYPAPTIDFKRFFEIRDTTNAAPLDYWTLSRADLSIIDPQRANFNQPAYVLPYEVDNRSGSATLGYMLYELWPHPLSVLPYTLSWMRRGNQLVNPTDTVPSPLTEDLLKWKAKQDFFLFKESQKGDGVARGSGADWKFLAESAEKKFLKRLKICADRDRDLCELYFRRFVRDAALGYSGFPYATQNSGLNVGRF
jgi:hypothetical protein